MLKQFKVPQWVFANVAQVALSPCMSKRVDILFILINFLNDTFAETYSTFFSSRFFFTCLLRAQTALFFMPSLSSEMWHFHPGIFSLNVSLSTFHLLDSSAHLFHTCSLMPVNYTTGRSKRRSLNNNMFSFTKTSEQTPVTTCGRLYFLFPSNFSGLH